MSSGVYIRTEEHKRKLSEARKKHSGPNKGKKFSDKHREKLSLSHIGINVGEKHPRWNGGKPNCVDCGKKLSQYYSKTNKCLRCTHKIPWNTGTKGLVKAWNKGMKGYRAGELNNRWKGGITPENKRLRNSLDFKEWSFSVKQRDNFTCQICGDNKGGNLHANHIKKFSDYKQLRFIITNGITLCKDCHIGFVTHHEPEWESYFNFNLITRGFVEDEFISTKITGGSVQDITVIGKAVL